ncbi:SDR family oxidoreductase [Brevibacterium sp. XM4083]|uniref:SDR family NAD(P)-dependent oxidoreductase n=2 Tax=unclassified Brevibacterium TaxID=2614124 RepID=UPI00202E9AD3|nr:SDR family oxidoreductase [Brevibacterium sp. XM4083]MCM1011292.1 SDR family oxidoreductase [Brevibacterium sp. XM4083]
MTTRTDNLPRAMLMGKRILVTGASKGIGAAIVRALHREGANLVLHFNTDRMSAIALTAELGHRVHAVGADLSDPSAGTRLWDEARNRLGEVDVLVNNAGAWIASPISDACGWSAGWTENLQLNLRAAADLCRLAVHDFEAQGGGAIITITSRSAHRGDDGDHLAYGAAKAGVLALTKGLARAFGHLGILAYAIAPGWVDTGLVAGTVDAKAEGTLPLRELTPPEDIAELVAFLASGRSRHLTGATLDVTGADYVR